MNFLANTSNDGVVCGTYIEEAVRKASKPKPAEIIMFQGRMRKETANDLSAIISDTFCSGDPEAPHVSVRLGYARKDMDVTIVAHSEEGHAMYQKSRRIGCLRKWTQLKPTL